MMENSNKDRYIINNFIKIFCLLRDLQDLYFDGKFGFLKELLGTS